MKMIIAVDGSEFSDRAVAFASAMLRGRLGDAVDVVAVVEPAASTELETIVEDTSVLDTAQNPAAREALRLAEAASAELASVLPADEMVVQPVVLTGPAARTIVEYAESQEADLLIVGSHGRGYWERFWLGSVSDRVVHHAPCSVLVVK